MNTPEEDANQSELDGAMPIAPTLGMWDAVSIIVGIVVGTAIFKSPTMVFRNVSGPWQAMGVWLLGGVLSLIGALCYAELATTYPRSGGDYHYLTKAFGRWMGFLFGWAQLAVILTGSIAAMAYAFAEYGVRMWGGDPEQRPATLWLAIGSIVVLSVMNLMGVLFGKLVQNIVERGQGLGPGGNRGGGSRFRRFSGASRASSFRSSGGLPDASLGLALVFVLYAYGGWNDAAFVAAEVRGRKRNLPLALLLGISLITVIYLLVILAYMLVLGFEGARQSFTPAADVAGDGRRTMGTHRHQHAGHDFGVGCYQRFDPDRLARLRVVGGRPSSVCRPGTLESASRCSRCGAGGSGGDRGVSGAGRGHRDGTWGDRHGIAGHRPEWAALGGVFWWIRDTGQRHCSGVLGVFPVDRHFAVRLSSYRS